MVALSRPARCCDWACEPWLAFDGDLTAVTAAAAGAPVAWRLNGDTAVTRSYTSCNEQTLTITTRAAAGSSSSACARTGSADGPDAVVHIGRLATSLGGGGRESGAAGSRPRWRTVAAPPSLRGGSAARGGMLRVYAFACPGGSGAPGQSDGRIESATAIVNRTCERLEDGAARTTKRIAIEPCRSAGGWFHVAVNIAAS